MLLGLGGRLVASCVSISTVDFLYGLDGLELDDSRFWVALVSSFSFVGVEVGVSLVIVVVVLSFVVAMDIESSVVESSVVESLLSFAIWFDFLFVLFVNLLKITISSLLDFTPRNCRSLQ